MADQDAQAIGAINRLLSLLRQLREKCPWDKAQTLPSLARCSLEEIYELVDAIDQQHTENLCEELGDLLEHLLFYAIIAEQEQLFSLTDVATRAHDKLVRRHPHIFSNTEQNLTQDQVLEQWENIKKQEGRTGVLSGLPRAMPALIKAVRIQEKAARVGFDFDSAEQAWHKVNEEMNELRDAVRNNTNKTEEFGDLIFALVNYARHIGVDADESLRHSNQKFINRFSVLETILAETKRPLKQCSLPEKIDLWAQAKQKAQQ